MDLFCARHVITCGFMWSEAEINTCNQIIVLLSGSQNNLRIKFCVINDLKHEPFHITMCGLLCSATKTNVQNEMLVLHGLAHTTNSNSNLCLPGFPRLSWALPSSHGFSGALLASLGHSWLLRIISGNTWPGYTRPFLAFSGLSELFSTLPLASHGLSV
mgnify:CR=1 FL=1